MPKISIIMPFYNLEKYAERAIRGAISQTYEDFEIIAVDDGSTDGTLEILNRMAKEDKRITVLTKENAGPGPARNMGLSVATGEYVWFFDGDDYMHSDAAEKLINAADGADMVVCNAQREFETHIEGPLFKLPTEEQVNSERRIADYFLGKINFGEFTDNKLFRRSFIEETGVLFEKREDIFAEDSYFLAKILKTMGRIAIVNEILVVYYQHEGQETYSIKKALSERCQNFLEGISEWYDHKYDFELKTRAFRFFYDIIYNDVNSGYAKFKKAVSNEYFLNKIKGMDKSTLTKKQKLIVALISKPGLLYSIIRKRGINAGKAKDELPEDLLTSQTKAFATNVNLLDRKHMLQYVSNTLFMRSLKRNYRRILSFALAVFIIMLAVNFFFLSKSQTMILRCNYSEAAKGFYPDGSWFDIFAVKSEDVLNKAIADNDLKNTDAKTLQSCIDVFAISSDDIISRAVDANTEGKDFYYITNEYTVTYNQKNKLKRNQAFDMLHYISEAYSDIFFENYTEKNTILSFTRDEVDFDSLEYIEIGEWFNDEVESIQQFISARVEENGSYRSDETGETFTNIQKMIRNFKSNDLERYRGFVSQTGLTKDKEAYVNKLDYKSDNLERNMSKQKLAQDFRVSAIQQYDSYITGVAFIPSVDTNNQFYMNRTMTGIDYLTKDAYNAGVLAENYQKRIQQNDTIKEDVTSTDLTGNDYVTAKQTADTMITSLCDQLEKISKIAVTTDNEYMNYKTMNYLEFIIPDKNVITLFKPHIAILVAILAGLAVMLVMWFEAMISAKLAILKSGEDEKDGTASEGADNEEKAGDLS